MMLRRSISTVTPSIVAPVGMAKPKLDVFITTEGPWGPGEKEMAVKRAKAAVLGNKVQVEAPGGLGAMRPTRKGQVNPSLLRPTAKPTKKATSVIGAKAKLNFPLGKPLVGGGSTKLKQRGRP